MEEEARRILALPYEEAVRAVIEKLEYHDILRKRGVNLERMLREQREENEHLRAEIRLLREGNVGLQAALAEAKATLAARLDWKIADVGSWAAVSAPYEFTETPGVYKEDAKMPTWEVEAKVKDYAKKSKYFAKGDDEWPFLEVTSPPPTPAQPPADTQSGIGQSPT